MKTRSLSLSKDFSIPAIDYAGQGNAILGIRDSGKTYTATKDAEQLLDAGIPIVVYDPVGVWKNLKVGTGKHKGYPVVVAGGEGSDIRLTAANAVELLRAAMKAGISLIFDFYSPELINKSTWIRIVQETIDTLMYENKAYNMRHVFLEEAAEFIPQRLQPQHSRVYASIERLARMGRNAKLGLTIINQRAEEVNKAILEICAFSLLHKQVGKNSLKSIQQWLELRQTTNAGAIIKSLPSLKPGQCWAIGQGEEAHLIQVEPKKTFHPDPKKAATEESTSTKTVDVSAFVEQMNGQLKKKEQNSVPVVASKGTPVKAGPNELAKLNEYMEEIKRLRSVIKEQEQSVFNLQKTIKHYKDLISRAAAILGKEVQEVISMEGHKVALSLPGIPKNAEKYSAKPVKNIPVPADGSYSPGKCAREIGIFLRQYPDRAFSKAQVAVATGYSVGSGGFNNALAELNSRGFIVREGVKLQINAGADLDVFPVDSPKSYSIHTYMEKLGKCEREIYQVLLDHPHDAFTKDQLAAATPSNYSPGSGGFNNSLSTLNTLELIRRENGMIRLNPELLEL